MIKRFHTTLALAAFLAPFAALSAQQKLPLEIGVDGGVFRSSFSSGGNTSSSTQVELPLRALRLALPINQKVAFEPAASFTRVATGSGSANSFAVDLALLVELSQDRAAPRWFLRPFVGFQQNSSNGLSAARSSLGVGGGVRLSLTDRISMRYEARYRYIPERSGVSGNVIGLLAGISVFTR